MDRVEKGSPGRINSWCKVQGPLRAAQEKQGLRGVGSAIVRKSRVVSGGQKPLMSNIILSLALWAALWVWARDWWQLAGIWI